MQGNNVGALCTSALVVMLLAFGSAQAADSSATQERPPWLEDDVIAAAIMIDMTEVQRPQFRDSITLFLESLREEVERLVRRGVPNLENAIKRKRKGLVRDMDERMAGFLSDAQMPAYETYRDLLLSKLAP